MSTKTKTQLHKNLKVMLKEFELAYYLSSPSLSANQIKDLREVITNIINTSKKTKTKNYV
jgi:ribosomal protein L10